MAGGVAHHDADLAGGAHLRGPPGRRPEVIGFARHHHPQAMLARQPHGVPAAGLGHPLSDGILAVENQARAVFGDHPAIRGGVDFAGQQLLHVKGDELNSVRIHAAQVGSHYGFGHQDGLMVRNPRAGEDLADKAGELGS